MSRRPEYTRTQRLVAGAMNVLTRRTQGYSVDFLPEVIRTHGLRGMVKFMGAVGKASGQFLSHYSERDAQALIAFAALWNGCAFCSRGHMLAANLYHFRDTGELFPIGETDVARLQRMTDPDALAAIREKLGPGCAPLLALVERQYALKSGTAEGTTPDDDWLRGAIAIWDWLNECTIVSNLDRVDPLAPIARDHGLRDRYDAARRRNGSA
jgi:hypothetical protein